VLLAKGAYYGAATWNTPVHVGTTPADRAHNVYFEYDDIESLEAAVKSVNGDAAEIKKDALLAVDEVRTGLRLSRHCVCDDLGASPLTSARGTRPSAGLSDRCPSRQRQGRQAA
jgi:glutamate-1-semialdehyde 2,1-aminomutase